MEEKEEDEEWFEFMVWLVGEGISDQIFKQIMEQITNQTNVHISKQLNDQIYDQIMEPVIVQSRVQVGDLITNEFGLSPWIRFHHNE